MKRGDEKLEVEFVVVKKNSSFFDVPEGFQFSDLDE
jgi:hypothetical protein